MWVPSLIGHSVETMFVPSGKEIVTRIQSVQDLLCAGQTTAEIFMQTHLLMLIVAWVN